MNIRQPLLRACTIGCGLLILSLCIFPGAARAAIKLEIKTSADAGMPPNSTMIAAVVKGAVADLSGLDSVKRQSARDQLSLEVNAPGGVTFSSQFFETYSKELNSQLAPLLDNPDAKIRLNVAIVVARVAERVNNTYMLDLTEKLLADKSPAVVLWGLTAAQNILPSLLEAGLPTQQQKLIADIKAQAKDPELLGGVYDALSLNYATVKINELPPNWNKAVTLVAPEILSLLAARRDLYLTQVAPEPVADQEAMNCLVNGVIWKQMTPAQQLQTIQLLSDVAGLAAQHADASSGAMHDQLVLVARQAVLATVAAAYQSGNSDFQKNVMTLMNLQASAQNVSSLIAVLPQAIKQVPAWSKISDPPTISEGSTTHPSTATVK